LQNKVDDCFSHQILAEPFNNPQVAQDATVFIVYFSEHAEELHVIPLRI